MLMFSQLLTNRAQFPVNNWEDISSLGQTMETAGLCHVTTGIATLQIQIHTLSLLHVKMNDFSSVSIIVCIILSWKNPWVHCQPIAHGETEVHFYDVTHSWSLHCEWQGGTGTLGSCFWGFFAPLWSASPASASPADGWPGEQGPKPERWMLEVRTQNKIRIQVQGHWATQWPSVTSAWWGPGSELTGHTIQQAQQTWLHVSFKPTLGSSWSSLGDTTAKQWIQTSPGQSYKLYAEERIMSQTELGMSGDYNKSEWDKIQSCETQCTKTSSGPLLMREVFSSWGIRKRFMGEEVAFEWVLKEGCISGDVDKARTFSLKANTNTKKMTGCTVWEIGNDNFFKINWCLLLQEALPDCFGLIKYSLLSALPAPYAYSHGSISQNLGHMFAPLDPNPVEVSSGHFLTCFVCDPSTMPDIVNFPKIVVKCVKGSVWITEEKSWREVLKGNLAYLGRALVSGVGACALFSVWWGAGEGDGAGTDMNQAALWGEHSDSGAQDGFEL